MAGQWEESHGATLSGSAMLFGWFADGEPTAGSVEYSLCRPVFPGSKRYRVEVAMQNPADLSIWGRYSAPGHGYVVAIDGLAAEDQYWIQGVHQPSSEEGGNVELTTWITPHDAWYRQELQLRARTIVRHWVPWFEWRIGYESFPGIWERFARGAPLRRPDAPRSPRGDGIVAWQCGSPMGTVCLGRKGRAVGVPVGKRLPGWLEPVADDARGSRPPYSRS